MATRFIQTGLYLVTIRCRDGGAYQCQVSARNHADAARQCAGALSLIWGG